MPGIDDSEVVRLSILISRQVNSVVIWLSNPTLFSEKTVMIYSLFIASFFYFIIIDNLFFSPFFPFLPLLPLLYLLASSL